MQCGHCGTQVNEGYFTCPACGAVYQRRIGIFAEMLWYMGWGCVVFAGFFFWTNGKVDETVKMLIAAGIVLVVLQKLLVWITPYRWWRRQP